MVQIEGLSILTEFNDLIGTRTPTSPLVTVYVDWINVAKVKSGYELFRKG
jgi:hypothetical protein